MIGFSLNDKVKIVDKDSYGGKFYNMYGVVKRGPISGCGSIGVLIDDVKPNNASRFGCYWFKSSKLQHVSSEEVTSNANDFDFPYAAEIRFIDNKSSQTYSYACYDEDISTGDWVVVKTGHHGLAVAEVINISTLNLAKDLVKFNREIVAKVDATNFNERCKKRERLNTLKHELINYTPKNNLDILRCIAKITNDTELKDKLNEYSSLGGEEF